MEEVLNKIAELTDMSVEGLLNSYPLLREQYINVYGYKRLSESIVLIEAIITSIWIMSSIAIFLTILDYIINKYFNKRVFIVWIALTIGLVLITIVSIILNAKIAYLAPDLLFIKSLLK